MICKIENCKNKVKAKGMCNAHYFRLRRHGSTDLPKTEKQKLLEVGKSKCASCKEIKSCSLFSKDVTTTNKLSAYCKSCDNIKSQERYLKNKIKYKDYSLKADFGIDIIEYNRLLKIQDFKCAICRKSEQSKSLSVDHCHKTNKVRGLLCSKCNFGLGHFNDSIKLLRAAIKYLKED